MTCNKLHAVISITIHFQYVIAINQFVELFHFCLFLARFKWCRMFRRRKECADGLSIIHEVIVSFYFRVQTLHTLTTDFSSQLWDQTNRAQHILLIIAFLWKTSQTILLRGAGKWVAVTISWLFPMSQREKINLLFPRFCLLDLFLGGFLHSAIKSGASGFRLFKCATKSLGWS